MIGVAADHHGLVVCLVSHRSARSSSRPPRYGVVDDKVGAALAARPPLVEFVHLGPMVRVPATHKFGVTGPGHVALTARATIPSNEMCSQTTGSQGRLARAA